MKNNHKDSWEFCQTLAQNDDSLKSKHIAKRSPVAKKRGRGRGNSRPSSKSRSRITSNIRSTITGSRGGKGQKVLSTLFGRKKGKLGNVGRVGNTGVKRKGGFLRKAGKYAVVGLAGKRFIKSLHVIYVMLQTSLYVYLHFNYIQHMEPTSSLRKCQKD